MPSFKNMQITFSGCIFRNEIKNKFCFHTQKYSDILLSEYIIYPQDKTWGYFQIVLKAPSIQNFTLKLALTYVTNRLP